MRTAFFLFIAICLYSCGDSVRGNGNVVQVTREVPNFQSLATLGSIDVEIQPGDNYSLQIVDDENIIPYVITEVKNGELQIQYKKGVSISSSHTKVIVTVPFLNSIRTSGSADITSKGLITNNQMVDLSSSGSGDMSLQLNAPAIKITGSGSGDFVVSGQTKDVKCTLTGSNNLDSKDLKAENVDVKITGSADAKVYASVSLRAVLTGSGSLLYWGNPSLPEVRVTGSGEVKAGE